MSPSELEAACEAVEAAALVCARVRGGAAVEALEKGDRSPVTVADFASQAVVARALQRSSPGIPLVAEEGSEALRRDENRGLLEAVAEACDADAASVLGWIDRGAAPAAGRFWTLDPIDGTKGFLRGDHYAVALALVEGGEVAAGVLGCPNLALRGHGQPEAGEGTIVWAARGGGAWQAPLGERAARGPVRVSPVRDIALARVCESVESGHSRHDLSAEAARGLGIAAAPVRIDSQAKYALVARGDAEVYWRLPTRPGYEEKIWDHAAGTLIVEEAGGAITDVLGARLDFTRGKTLSANRGVLATNGPFHEALVRVFAPHFGRRG